MEGSEGYDLKGDQKGDQKEGIRSGKEKTGDWGGGGESEEKNKVINGLANSAAELQLLEVVL